MRAPAREHTRRRCNYFGRAAEHPSIYSRKAPALKSIGDYSFEDSRSSRRTLPSCARTSRSLECMFSQSSCLRFLDSCSLSIDV